MEEVISVGLIRGRHPDMPVEEYIFESVSDVHDYDAHRKRIGEFLVDRVGIDAHACGQGINQNDYTDVQIFRGKRKLRVYVTGLTPVVTSLVSVCLRNGVDLTLLHYDKDTKTYRDDPV